MAKSKQLKEPAAEPWEIPLQKRIGFFFENPHKRKVVYLYEKADTSTFRYRVYNMCQALSFSNSWAGSYFFENELQALEKYLPSIDVVIFCRTRWSVNFNQFLNVLKKYKIVTLLDVDDLVFDVEWLPVLMNSINVFFTPQDNDYWFSYAARIWSIGKQCDATIGTNEFLCKQLQTTFNKPAYVINNFLNQEQISFSEPLFNQRNSSYGDPFVLGYFSGSPSHSNDFKKIVRELAELLHEFPEMILNVVGFMEFPQFLQEFIRKERIVHHPLVNFLTLQKKVAEADLNLIPLHENEFTNCKSELKFFEAAIVGTISCATPTFVYRENIQQGVTGYLCEQGKWYDTIETIYRNPKDQQMIHKARKYCLDKYHPKSQCHTIEKVLDEVVYSS